MNRRHDLDWLRVLLFALLVPHHVAVGFVDWGVDIYRFVNNQLAGDGMTLFIYWSHSWRLPSLFLISGIGTYFLTRRGIGLQFMSGRIARLMVPAVFGFFFLNVFGGYAIAVMTDDPRRFTSFWSDWLTDPIEMDGQKQASWRTDPARSGGSGCMGDIGTHAHNLAEYITDKKMTHVAADLSIFVDGRRLDDDGSALFRMEDGVKGTLSASQICVGNENSLSIRVYGETGGLEWRQEEPNTLLRTYIDRPTEILRAGQGYLSEGTQSGFRTPPGHPEGYLEAFANVYLDFAQAVRSGEGVTTGIEGGVRGMAFVEALLTSSQKNSKWVEIKS